jgi:hypothetical protein
VDNQNGKQGGFYSRKLKAGKRRTYFFDVRNTKQGDFYLTITESKKRFDNESFESHKIFLYKEDFKKFMEALQDSVEHIKTELMPDFDYDTDRQSYYQSQANEPNGNIIDKTEDDFNSNSAISDDEQINW